jgi:hypothetical protein
MRKLRATSLLLTLSISAAALVATVSLTASPAQAIFGFFNKRPESLTALSKMSESQLDSLYRSGNVKGPIPHGNSDGYPILIADGKGLEGLINSPVNDFVNHLWKGKVFTLEQDGGKTYLVNKILLLKNTRAEVFKANSEFDGKPSIQLNYRHSEMAWARDIIDEIRMVKVPNNKGGFYQDLYLGRAMISGKFICYFALQFPPQK